jgi:hypothetical protein
LKEAPSSLISARLSESDRGIQQHVEVIRIVRSLIEIIKVENDSADALLHAGIELVRVPGCNGKLLVSPRTPLPKPPAPSRLRGSSFSLYGVSVPRE